MQLTVTARHLTAPPMLEEMLRAKAEKLDRLGHKLSSLHAIFGREKYLYTAELTLSTKGARLVGRAKHPTDLLSCMEQALAKLERQLQRRQDKQMGLARRRAAHRPG